MSSPRLEIGVGVFVLAGLVGVAGLAVKSGAGRLLPAASYPLKARFANVGGLARGSPVLLAGVTIGQVKAVTLDANFGAIVELEVRQGLRLPADTMASIRTLGLIGDKYLALLPGADDRALAENETITETESAVDIESLLGRFAFGQVHPKPDSK